MLKLRHNLRWQASAFFILLVHRMCRWHGVWYIEQRQFSTSWNDKQAAPPDYSHHQSRKKSYFSEHSMTILLKSTNDSLRSCFITLTWKFMTYTLWELLATLNEWFFPGSNLEKNCINICSCNNSSDFHYISLHHRHLHDVTGTSSCFFLRIQPYFEFIDICIQANRLTLYQCTKINRFVCKVSAFRTQNNRSFSVLSTSGWLRSHFKGRIFGKYGKFLGIWHVTKLCAYKRRIALFDFQ